jgi:hypothetical protein
LTEATRQAPGRTLLDRLVAAYPLVLAYIVLLILYAWQTTRHSTPWNFTDELKWALLSRSIAHTGHAMLLEAAAPYGSVYSYFLAPAWWAGASLPGYTAAKYLNAFAMTASLFPAYLFGRMFLPRPAAWFAAIGTAAIPALAYTGLLIPESLAYLWSTIAILLLARALLRPTWLSIALAAAAAAAGPLVRSQLAILMLTVAIAGALAVFWSARGRELRLGWSRGERLRAFVLFVGLVIFVDVLIAQHSYQWFIGTHFWHRAFTYGLWALGAFTIGVGVLPVLFALAWALSARVADRVDRTLLAIFVGAVVSFALYAAVKASYESTVFSIRIWERNVIYLGPVVFVAAARWVVAGRRRLVPLLVAACATGYLLATTPYHAYEHFYSDAPGLSILQWLNRTWSLTIPDLQRVLFGILAFGVLLALAATFQERLPRRLVQAAGGVVVAVTAIAVLAWNLTGEIAAANASNSFSKTIVALPTPPDWIDRATGRERTLFVGQQLSNSNAFWSIQFWNQSIQDVWTVDGSYPGLGQTWTPNFGGADGEVIGPRISDRWGVAPENITLAGRSQEVAGGLRLYRLAQPIRITSFSQGVSPDGWMSTESSYLHFGKPDARPGTAFVSMSRAAACGDIAPSILTIRVSRLNIDLNTQPTAGRRLAVKRVLVRSNPCQKSKTVRFRVRPPFRIDVTATGLFRPADGRQLSVQVGYAFKPSGL